MAEIPAVKVTECLGWRITDDKQVALLGFRDAQGNPFNLAIGEGDLKVAALALLDATGAFPKAKMEEGSNWLIPADWFDVGANEDGQEFLRMRLSPSGGNLAFSLPAGMLANMRDVLVARLGPGSNPMTPGRAQH